MDLENTKDDDEVAGDDEKSDEIPGRDKNVIVWKLGKSVESIDDCCEALIESNNNRDERTSCSVRFQDDSQVLSSSVPEKQGFNLVYE